MAAIGSSGIEQRSGRRGMSMDADIATIGSALWPARRHRVLLDAGIALEGMPMKVAAEICWPAEGALDPSPLAFVCLPGGSINRRYYDLGGDQQPSFSFARQMADRGF